jgi:copper resistance protein D
MNAFLVLIRAIHFGAALWLFGEFVFHVAVLEPSLRNVSPESSAGRLQPGRRLVRVGGFCVAMSIASAIAWLLLEAAGMSGMPFATAMNWRTIDTVLAETLFGRVWVCRFAISILLMVVLAGVLRQESPSRQRLVIAAGIVLAGAYAVTLAWTGHASADSGFDRYIHLGSDAVHLLAAGAWVGVLPGLIALLWRVPGSQEGPELAASAAHRFSAVGLFAVSALALTGIVNSWYLVGSVGALFATTYGQLLMCKLALFALMLALAATNRLRETPRLAGRAPVAGDDSRQIALGRLRRNATVEVAAGVAIIGIVAILGITMPAAHMARHAQSMPGMSESHGR